MAESNKRILSNEEYKKIIAQNEAELNKFIKEGRQEYSDFDEFEKLFTIELLGYEQYCDENNFRTENDNIEEKKDVSEK